MQALLAERGERGGSAGEYILAPGDLLAVTIYSYRPDGGTFSSDARVDDRGYLSLPMIDPVRAAGLSLAEVRRGIVTAFRRAEVLKEPLISTFLKEYQGQQVVVLGAVTRPGMYSLSRGRQTLVDVLSLAGGLTPTAGNYVFFQPDPRSGGAEGEAMPRAAALHAAGGDLRPGGDGGMLPICLDAADGGTNPAIMGLPLRGGDTVLIPEAGQAFIDGEVAKPGYYPLSRGVTVTQLISSAGGARFPADLSRVKLIRSTTGAQRSEWELDFSRIEDGDRPDVRLDRNDSVVVPARPGRKIVYSVYEFVTAIVRVTIGGAATIF